MQTSPNDKKDQLLRATSVYLVNEGYFRNPKRIYTHLWERAYRDVNAASNGLHSWHQCRTYAHYLARFGTYDGDAEEIDMALLDLYEITSLKYCNTCGTRCIKAGQCRKCKPIKYGGCLFFSAKDDPLT